MERYTIKPDLQPEEVAKRIIDMQVSDVVRIEQYGYSANNTVDKSKFNLAMIVHRVVGGWIYEVMADGDGQIWRPVFVTEQTDLVDDLLRVLDNLPEGVIKVRQA